MSASISDLFQKLGGTSSLVNTPKVTATRSAAGATLTVDNCNWDTTTGKVFITYRVDTSGAVVSGTETVWAGIVTGSTTIGSLTRLAGASDTGNAIGDYVELPPASLWANKLVQGLLVQHNQDGTHGAVTVTSLANTGNISQTNGSSITDDSTNELVKFAKTASAVNEVTVTNAATGNAPQLGATGGDTNIDLKLAGKGTGTVQVPSQFKGLVHRRQGGATGDASWATTGTTTVDTSAKQAFIQTGSVTASSSADTTITFPVAFTQIPLVFVSSQAAVGIGQATSVTATNFVLNNFTTANARQAVATSWIAIGQ